MLPNPELAAKILLRLDAIQDRCLVLASPGRPLSTSDAFELAGLTAGHAELVGLLADVLPPPERP